MEILKFDSGQSPKPKRGRAGYVSVLAAGLFVAAIGSTFAASITINEGSTTEYGQGVTSTVACDQYLTVVPENTFVNASVSPDFKLVGVTISDSRTASNAGLGLCAGKSIKITAYGASPSTSKLALYTDVTECILNITTYNSGSDGMDGTTTSCGSPTVAAVSNGIRLYWPSANSTDTDKLASASSIAVLTLESQNTTS